MEINDHRIWLDCSQLKRYHPTYNCIRLPLNENHIIDTELELIIFIY